MDYNFHFGDVWAAWDDLAWGAVLTIRLSAMAMALSLAFAVLGALGQLWGGRVLRALITAYVEFIRNTPFLIQVFMIFFGLPTLGLRLSPNDGALLAMVLNGTAYAIEIVRAGIEAVPRGPVEAGFSLGLRKLQVFRLIILPQALRVVFAPIGAQFILLMLNSSVVSIIAAQELTAVANDIQSRTFRSFEVFMVVTVIYFILSMLFTGVFALLERLFFPRLDRR